PGRSRRAAGLGALAEGRERYPERMFHFQAARLAAAEGDEAEALDELRRAVAADPSARERAQGDRLLAGLAGRLG
ncbi:MAG TPA: hypothetical protein VD704_02805, partial [Gaiellaceae bacterium]|nr:hypothetical protein [Gaiellaceae bacterium]